MKRTVRTWYLLWRDEPARNPLARLYHATRVWWYLRSWK